MNELKNSVPNIDAEHRERLKKNPRMWWYRDSNGMKEVRCEKSKLISDRLWELSERITCMPFGVEGLEREIDIASFLDKAELILKDKVECTPYNMPANYAHDNAVAIQDLVGDKVVEVWRGFYLVNGLWREHSWCKLVSTGQFIETTVEEPADAYFGVRIK